MANFTPTNLLSALSVVSEKYQGGEWRPPDSAALSTAYTGEKTNDSLSLLRTREDRATYYDFPIRKADDSLTERLYNHAGSRTDSLRTQLTWKTVIDAFSISEKQLDNNTQTYEDAFAKGIKSCVYNCLKQADDWYVAQLLANRTHVNEGGVRGAFNTTDYVMELDSDQGDYWKEQIAANLRQNEYNSELMIIADSLASIDMKRSLNQGQQNGTNLSYQFGDGEIVTSSKSLLSGLSTYNGTAFAFPMDMAGLFFWIPKQNRKPLDLEKAMSVNGDLGSIQVPVMDDKGNVVFTIDAAISMYTVRADTSSYNGSKQDLVSQIEVSWDMASMVAPLSTFRGASDSVIYAYGLSNV